MAMRYIVVFKEFVTEEVKQQYEQTIIDNGGHITNRYNGILNGFAAVIPDHLLTSLQASSVIAYIEPDGTVSTQ